MTIYVFTFATNHDDRQVARFVKFAKRYYGMRLTNIEKRESPPGDKPSHTKETSPHATQTEPRN